MLLLDVNVVMAAIRPHQSEDNASVRRWLDDRLNEPRTVLLSDLVVLAMIRIATNRRAFPDPVTPVHAVQFADTLRGAPPVRMVQPGSRHWSLFTGLVVEHGLRGNDITDAYLAALALEQRATFVTRDRGFRRFRQLTTLDPLDDV